jgi:hypothetical protein
LKNPAWLIREQWRPIKAPLQGSPSARSAQMLEDVLAQFDVTQAARYAPTERDTWCNIFVWDATSALGCEIPHWYESATGKSVPMGKGAEMSANGMCDWLENKRNGWMPASRADAVARAGFGFPVVLAWRNPGKGASHVAMMLPDGSIAQAGRKCLWRAPISAGFGRYVPAYFTHN